MIYIVNTSFQVAQLKDEKVYLVNQGSEMQNP